MAAAPLRQPHPVDPDPPPADARLRDLEERFRQLMDSSADRLHDFERRIEFEWIALRQLYEERLRELRSRPVARSPIPAPAPSQSELLERLRDIQSDTRELLSVVRSQSQAARAAAAGATAPGESPSEPGRGWKVATAALASAAMILAALGVYSRWITGKDLQSANARIEVLESRLEELQRQAQRQTANGGVVAQRLIQNELARAARAEKVVNVLASADLREFRLIGKDVAPAASGRAFWSRSRGVVISASALPTLVSNEVYQFWVNANMGPVPLGLLTVDERGRATDAFEIAADLSVFDFFVSVEPAGGSVTPGRRPALVTLR